VDYGTYTHGMTISNSNFNTYFSVLVPSNESNLDQLIIKGSQFQTINNIISVDSDVGSILLADNLFIVGSANEYALTIVCGHAITITGNAFESLTNSGTTAISVTGASSYNQNANTIVANHFDGFATPINLGSGSKGWNVQSNAYANNSGPNLNSGVGNMLGGGSQ
jgi:nitrous oxidase accessory protein NosD